MSIVILPETFQPLGRNARDIEIGIVDVNLGREVVTVKASRLSSGTISAAGFVGRYQTSRNPWRASVVLIDGRMSFHFGRDDRSGRFQKERGISYEPATYETLIDPTFYQPVAASEA